MPKDIGHYQLIQQALQLLEEGLAIECNSGTLIRPRKRPGKDGGKGGRGN